MCATGGGQRCLSTTFAPKWRTTEFVRHLWRTNEVVRRFRGKSGAQSPVLAFSARHLAAGGPRFVAHVWRTNRFVNQICANLVYKAFCAPPVVLNGLGLLRLRVAAERGARRTGAENAVEAGHCGGGWADQWHQLAPVQAVVWWETAFVVMHCHCGFSPCWLRVSSRSSRATYLRSPVGRGGRVPCP